MRSSIIGLGLWCSVVMCAVFAQAEPKAQMLPKDNPEITEYYLSAARNKDAPLSDKMIATLPPHQQAFVRNYEKVKLFKDEDLLASLVHPVSKACETDETTDYFANIRYFYLTEELPEEYRLQFITVEPDKRVALQKRLRLPLEPTHVMYIEFYGGVDPVTGKGHIEGWQRYLREEQLNGEKMIFELVRCPTPEDMKEFYKSAS